MGQDRHCETAFSARVDARGLVCPMPLIRLQQQIEGVDRGQRVEVIADDKGFGDDLPAWSEATGHRLIAIDNHPDGYCIALVEKA